MLAEDQHVADLAAVAVEGQRASSADLGCGDVERRAVEPKQMERAADLAGKVVVAVLREDTADHLPIAQLAPGALLPAPGALLPAVDDQHALAILGRQCEFAAVTMAEHIRRQAVERAALPLEASMPRRRHFDLVAPVPDTLAVLRNIDIAIPGIGRARRIVRIGNIDPIDPCGVVAHDLPGQERVAHLGVCAALVWLALAVDDADDLGVLPPSGCTDLLRLASALLRPGYADARLQLVEILFGIVVAAVGGVVGDRLGAELPHVVLL